MHKLKNPWLQLLLVAATGTALGLQYGRQRQSAGEWSRSHYRLNASAGFPMLKGIPFSRQYFLDENGRRIEVPVARGETIDHGDASWWSIEDSGRMRLWNRAHEEVFATRLEGPPTAR